MIETLKAPMADPLCFRGTSPWDYCYGQEKAADVTTHFAIISPVLRGCGDSWTSA